MCWFELWLGFGVTVFCKCALESYFICSALWLLVTFCSNSDCCCIGFGWQDVCDKQHCAACCWMRDVNGVQFWCVELSTCNCSSILLQQKCTAVRWSCTFPTCICAFGMYAQRFDCHNSSCAWRLQGFLMCFHARADADLSAELNGMLCLTCYLPKYASVPVRDHNHQLSTLSQHRCTGLPALE